MLTRYRVAGVGEHVGAVEGVEYGGGLVDQRIAPFTHLQETSGRRVFNRVGGHRERGWKQETD